MTFGFRRRFTTNNLMAFCTVAVLIPALGLSWLQYRSLQQLRMRAKLAVQDQVRQGLEVLRQRLEANVRAIGQESLQQFDARDLASEHLNATGAKFLSISRKHPAVEHVFVASECSCRGEPFAILSTDNGAGWIKCSQFSGPIIADALSAFRAARGIPGSTTDTDLMYFQASWSPGKTIVYIFRFLPDSARPKDGASYTGLSLNVQALVQEVVPQVSAALKQRDGAGTGDLAFAVAETGRGVIFSTDRDLKSYEVAIHGGPMFPLWTISGRCTETAIESLAGQQFRNGLQLSGIVCCCLILAITLSLRVVAKEAKLAELKSAFVSNVSHEMKTPLALIKLFSETLELGRVSDPGKLRHYYGVIHKESQRLTHLIERVLDFARTEAGRKAYEFAPGDMAAVVEDVLNTYRESLMASGFRLTVDIHRGLPTVMIDSNAMTQAILNLLDNALKYSRENKEISVRVSESDKEVAVEVADRGIGIPASELERIFEKFHRVSTGLVHETQGSGLGLSLTRHIVEAHGGRIQVESALGHGSRFSISVPVAPAADVAETRPLLSGETFAESAHS